MWQCSHTATPRWCWSSWPALLSLPSPSASWSAPSSAKVSHPTRWEEDCGVIQISENKAVSFGINRNDTENEGFLRSAPSFGCSFLDIEEHP